MTIFKARIMPLCTIAVCQSRPTNALRQPFGRCSHSLCQGEVVGLGERPQQEVNCPVPPFEGRIILCDLALLIERIPRVDLDGDFKAFQGWEYEIEAMVFDQHAYSLVPARAQRLTEWMQRLCSDSLQNV